MSHKLILPHKFYLNQKGEGDLTVRLMKSYNTCLGVGSTLHVSHLQWPALSHWEASFFVTQSISASSQHQKPETLPGGESSQNYGSKILEAQLVPSYTTSGLYSRLEKLGGKGNKLPHLMAWKKLYFEHIFTIRWLHLCIQMSWTQYICDTLFSEYRQQVTVSPHFCLSVFVCLSQKGNKRSFWISGKFS